MSNRNNPAAHVVEREGFAEITLTRSRKIDGMDTAVVRMREPTVADMERFQESAGSEAQREVVMIANLCEISPDALREFPLRDYQRMQAGFAVFTN
ncbi:phage tail assembly protein [Stenotrophomonas maltophilia]|uniref:phage tail assembly protein n=1 Tax=Stenotrophomonas maltophilia TaxID=40324 RepID=UPI002B1D8DDF|nr:phage tail assembly protein [Stenotrophomonas maltophilia]